MFFVSHRGPWPAPDYRDCSRRQPGETPHAGGQHLSWQSNGSRLAWTEAAADKTIEAATRDGEPALSLFDVCVGGRAANSERHARSSVVLIGRALLLTTSWGRIWATAATFPSSRHSFSTTALAVSSVPTFERNAHCLEDPDQARCQLAGLHYVRTHYDERDPELLRTIQLVRETTTEMERRKEDLERAA